MKLSFPLLSLCAFNSLFATSQITQAQVTSDGTVNTQINQNGNVSEITGGETRGSNLFHSFREFSLQTGSEAFFDNAAAISNIFSRVTGGEISNIDGLIRANDANLFLINPAGIVFGENARLDLGGSFYGSSASSILFEDGEFSAVDNLQQPILTINAPIGLSFRDEPGDIVNRSIANGAGLSVNEANNISLIGGNVSIENGGIIFAPGGRIELGGLIEAGTVNIAENNNLNFPDDIARGNVTLTDSAIVAVFSGGGGSIGVNTANLELTNGSRFLGGIGAETGSFDVQAGDIVIDATDSVSIDGQGDNNTGILANVRTDSIGNAGNININTDSLTLSNLASLDNSTSGQGNAGNININAANSIAIEGQAGNSFNTNIVTNAFNSSGNAGDINLNTGSLTLNNGASLVANGDNQSSAGNITINANDAVSLANQSNINVVTGADGGSLTINAKSLSITSESNLFAGTNLDSASAEIQAGDIAINVTENILIDSLGESSQGQTSIVNSNFSSGNAGNININAKNIDFKNGGNIFSTNSGQGSIGNISLTASENINFDGISSFFRSGVNNFTTATGTGYIGSIEITAQNLTLSNGAVIQSSVAGMANSGDININVTDDIRIDGISNPVLGDGTVTTVNSEIASEAASDSNGNSGNINITTGSLFISNGGAISSDLFGTGNAGNITINATDTVSIKDLVEGELPEVGIRGFASNISARVIGDAVGNGGSIAIDTENFSITNLALLTTTSASQGDAGNITVNATDSFIADNSLITSNIGDPTGVSAIGKVGNISINAENIALSNTAQIQAGAFSGGTVEETGTVSLTARESISFTGLNTGVFSNNDPGSFGNASNTQLFAPSITLNDGAVIVASNGADGRGGNITVESEQLSLNSSRIDADAEGNEGEGANINLQVADNITLRNNSFISARAFNDANGGNLTIDTNFIVAFPSNGNGNDIIASAEQGGGGNININAESLFGIVERQAVDRNNSNDIDASSDFGLDGTISILTPDVDILSGTTELPRNVVEA